MAETETHSAAGLKPEIIKVGDLVRYLQVGKEIISDSDVGDPRKPGHTLLGKDQILSSPNQIDGLINRGITNAKILHNDGVVRVEFIQPEEQGRSHTFYQGTTGINDPIKYLIGQATGSMHAQLLQTQVLDDCIADAIAFLNQSGLKYKTHEKPFFEAYKRNNGREDYGAEYRMAVGTTLLAMARGNELPETAQQDKKAFAADKEQIALGTFMTPIALRMVPGHKAKASNHFQYAGRTDAEVAGVLLHETGFSDTVSLIARCSRKDYPLEELAKKHVRIRLPYEARNDYQQLFGSK